MSDLVGKELAIFVLEKLIEQGGCSVNLSTNLCRYRGENGRKCAAGHCIPDEQYVHYCEGKNINVFKNKLITQDLITLQFLVRVHDQSLVRYDANKTGKSFFTDEDAVSRFQTSLGIFKSDEPLDTCILKIHDELGIIRA